MTLVFTVESYQSEMDNFAVASQIASSVTASVKVCDRKSRKYCLPVNRETGYKYRHRANYKS